MPFGQQSGSPAPARQVQELLELLIAAGHSDFRDARGPMGFNQRQAGGTFTRDEAAAFIEQLQQAADEDPPPAAAPTGIWASARTMRDVPAEQLATELRRRGWTVTEP
ncbi:MAG: hypothetical protein QOK39_1776 [Acidimicrobiaceae bacterium]|nr:hypothetical protein [Acidimicrobiaceae bacterium]